MPRETNLPDVKPNPTGLILAALGVIVCGVGIVYGSTEIAIVGASIATLGALLQVYIKARGRRG